MELRRLPGQGSAQVRRPRVAAEMLRTLPTEQLGRYKSRYRVIAIDPDLRASFGLD